MEKLTQKLKKVIQNSYSPKDDVYMKLFLLLLIILNLNN